MSPGLRQPAWRQSLAHWHGVHVLLLQQLHSSPRQTGAGAAATAPLQEPGAADAPVQGAVRPVPRPATVQLQLVPAPGVPRCPAAEERAGARHVYATRGR